MLFVLARAGTPQAIGSGAISGHIMGEDGKLLRAMVTLQPTTRLASGTAKVLHAPTRLDGSFAFQQLAAGTYSLCAQIPAEQARRGQAFLDSCQWGQFQSVQLSAAQAAGGIQIVAPNGAPLQIRVNDPDGVLTKTQGPMVFDSKLQLTITAPGKLPLPIPISSTDAAGRTHAIVAPFDTPLSVSVNAAPSLAAAAFDQTGKPIQSAIPVEVPKGATSAPITITVHRQN